jgi:hypothetical protein
VPSHATHSKLKLNRTSKTARSEFRVSKSVTQKKEMHGNKDTLLDDSKPTPMETNVLDETLEKAPTPPDITTAADKAVKKSMTETAVTGNATSKTAPTPPNITSAADKAVKKSAMETAAMGNTMLETAPTPPDVTSAADKAVKKSVTETAAMGNATLETAPTPPDITSATDEAVKKSVTETILMVHNKTRGVENKFAIKKRVSERNCC